MPSVIDESGVECPDGGRPDLSSEQLSRAVDLIIVRLRSGHYKFKEIGVILNRRPDTIRSRYRRIPSGVRRHYASLSMG